MSGNDQFRNKNGAFIGGAAAVRKRAAISYRRIQRKATAIPITNPMHLQTLQIDFLSKKMRPMERFFAALFKSSPRKFFDSHDSSKGRKVLMQEVCGRVKLPLPARLESQSANLDIHLERLAALVLEESRFTIAELLFRRWNGVETHQLQKELQRRAPQANISLRKNDNEDKVEPPVSGLKMRLSSRKKVSNHATVLFLEKETPFTKADMFNNKSGNVFELYPKDQPSLDKVLLGTITQMREDNQVLEGLDDDVSSRPNGKKGAEKMMAIMIYRETKLAEGDVFWVQRLTTMVSQSRQFEACTYRPKVGFRNVLLGLPQPVHTRFNEDGDATNLNESNAERGGTNNGTKEGEATKTKQIITTTSPAKPHFSEEESGLDSDSDSFDAQEEEVQYADYDVEEARKQFVIPELNPTQTLAQRSFLESDYGSITLVQGPPGTGKSSCITSTLCNYLLTSDGESRRRIMICAPTNKAVTVLASRYLTASRGCQSFTAVMVGDKEKLLVDENPALKEIFAYSWIESTIAAWDEIKRSLKSRSPDTLLRMVSQLSSRMERQLPKLSQTLLQYAELVKSGLVELFACSGSPEKVPPIHRTISSAVDTLMECMEDIEESSATSELLNTADVIFCTLTSSGAQAVKKTKMIDDLIVDEAAAATEPELYIPFHLQPRRLMVVGDPKQLPATVMSHFAEKLGLNRSLHERLMFDCKLPHLMLDVQYRMKPEISCFPARSFYGGKITNGPNVCSNSYRSSVPLMRGHAFSFVQIDGQEQRDEFGSSYNRSEAQRIVDIVMEWRRIASRQSSDWFKVDKIRIITFYQAQVNLIRQIMKRVGLGNITVSTVDSSQGCEADHVIISFVRSANRPSVNLQSKSVVGFLSDNRRLNVALTRAKYQLICVGNAECLAAAEGAPTVKALMEHSSQTNSISDYRPNTAGSRHGGRRDLSGNGVARRGQRKRGGGYSGRGGPNKRYRPNPRQRR